MIFDRTPGIQSWVSSIITPATKTISNPMLDEEIGTIQTWYDFCPPFLYPTVTLQLIVGDFSLSVTQAKSQFAIWSIFAAVSNNTQLAIAVLH